MLTSSHFRRLNSLAHRAASFTKFPTYHAKYLSPPVVSRGLSSTEKGDNSIKFSANASDTKKKRAKLMEFSVDRSNLIQFKATPDDPNLPKVAKEPLTPLGKDLLSYIQLKGPITLHDFMSQAANHLIHGYYQSKTSDKIGVQGQGDFITAPELSQLFGESIGLFCVMQYQKMLQSHKSKLQNNAENNSRNSSNTTSKPLSLPVQLIECGPGKGTLMADILKVAKKFPSFCKGIHIHFVELSQHLRVLQYQTLLKLSPTNNNNNDSNSITPVERIEDNVTYSMQIGDVQIPVTWHSFIHQVPTTISTPTTATTTTTTTDNNHNNNANSIYNKSDETVPCIFIGQEFLDAFPVHQFSYTEKGWREKLVDIDTTNTSKHHFRFVLSPNETPAIKSLLLSSKNSALTNLMSSQAKNHHHMNSSSSSSSSSSSVIGKQEKKVGERSKGGYLVDNHGNPLFGNATTTNTTRTRTTTDVLLQIGDGIEISPLALSSVQDIGKRLLRSPLHSSAVFIDYGENGTQADTVRAFQNHAQTHVFSALGESDVTADVDFSQVRKVLEQVSNEMRDMKKYQSIHSTTTTAANSDNTSTSSNTNRTTNVSSELHVFPLVTQGEFLLSLGIVERVQQLIALPTTSEEDANYLVQALKMLVDPAQMGKRFKVLQVEHSSSSSSVESSISSSSSNSHNGSNSR